MGGVDLSRMSVQQQLDTIGELELDDPRCFREACGQFVELNKGPPSELCSLKRPGVLEALADFMEMENIIQSDANLFFPCVLSVYKFTPHDSAWFESLGIMKVCVDILLFHGDNETVLRAAMGFFRLVMDDAKIRESALKHGVVDSLLEMIGEYDQRFHSTGGLPGEMRDTENESDVPVSDDPGNEQVEKIKEDIRMFVLRLWTHRGNGRPNVETLNIPHCPKERLPNGQTPPATIDQVSRLKKVLDAKRVAAPKLKDPFEVAVAATNASSRGGAAGGRGGASSGRGGGQTGRSTGSSEIPKTMRDKRGREKKIPEHIRKEFEVKKKAIYWAREISEQLGPDQPFPEPEIGPVFKNKAEVELAKKAILESRGAALKAVHKEASKDGTYVKPGKRGVEKASWNSMHKVSDVEKEVQHARVRTQTVQLIGEMQVRQAAERDRMRSERQEKTAEMIQKPLVWERQREGVVDEAESSSLGERVLENTAQRHQWEQTLGSARDRSARVRPAALGRRLTPSPRPAGP